MPSMEQILERRLGRASAATYDRIRRVEQKVKGVFPDAEFLLVVGDDHALHLRVYAGAESKAGVIELVEDDLGGWG